jgi:hypothetical protein
MEMNVTPDQEKAKDILGVVNHYLRLGDYPHLSKGEFAVVAQALLAFSTLRPEGMAISLLRAWVAGCGDEHFSTKEQCRDLLKQSGDYLASLSPQPSES